MCCPWSRADVSPCRAFCTLSSGSGDCCHLLQNGWVVVALVEVSEAISFLQPLCAGCRVADAVLGLQNAVNMDGVAGSLLFPQVVLSFPGWMDIAPVGLTPIQPLPGR